MSTTLHPSATRFLGGRACLDFANTVDWRTSAHALELVPDYAALLAWSVARGTLAPAAADRLAARAATLAAAAVLARAHALRAHVWRGMAQGWDLPAINRLLDAAPAQLPLRQAGEACLHDLPGTALEEPLWPLLWSLTAVLTSADAARLACCQAQGCGWLFVDESPNRTRLWCSSESCGNRERARRAYARRKAR